MPSGESPLPREVLAAPDAGDMIEAIRRLREATGLGLKEARGAVDAHIARLPIAAAHRPTVRRESGRLAWIALLLLLAGAGLWLLR